MAYRYCREKFDVSHGNGAGGVLSYSCDLLSNIHI